MFYTLARKGRAELQAFSQTSQKEERRFEAFDSGSFSTHNRLARLGKPHDNMTKASRPSMKTPSTAGMRNYLLAPDVPQCPWSFQDITEISPISYLNAFHAFSIRTQRWLIHSKI